MLGEEGVGSTVCQCGRPDMKPSEYQQRLRISRARGLLEFSRDSADWYDAESILESHTHRDPPLNCVAEPSVSDSIAACRASGQGFAALQQKVALFVTSSARVMSVRGTSRPSVLQVLRLVRA